MNVEVVCNLMMKATLEFIWVIVGHLFVVFIPFKICLKHKHTGDIYICNFSYTEIYTCVCITCVYTHVLYLFQCKKSMYISNSYSLNCLKPHA